MKTKKFFTPFRLIYLVYLAVLAALVIAATVYVGSLLREYEASQPENHVKDAVAQLAADAQSADFWEKYDLPQVSLGEYESALDLRETYLALCTDGELTYSLQSGSSSEDELCYTVESSGFPVAQVSLKAAGPAVTKLAVFSIREWAVESVTPVVEAHEYTLTVPSDFSVQLNGTALTGQESGRQTTYTVSGLYLKPDFAITDEDGNRAEYTLKKDKVLVEYFDYSLTLPSILMVTLDGRAWAGENAGSGLMHYEITSLTQPAVTISDYYGNTVNYEGGDELPLTYAAITASDRYTVTVAGEAVPAGAVTITENPDYTHFADYVDGLPQLCQYDIAVLQKDAEITVTDENGQAVALDPDATTHDLTQAAGLDTVPEAVSSEINVLEVAQNWSLFLSRDLAYAQVQKALIPGSYQYDVATKYAYGIDITFFSKHTLLNPPFVNTSVTNFVWITEDCFSVDISFVKQMLVAGTQMDDPMNDRFYFVKYDATNDGVDNPTWLLASMKEIVNE